MSVQMYVRLLFYQRIQVSVTLGSELQIVPVPRTV